MNPRWKRRLSIGGALCILSMGVLAALPAYVLAEVAVRPIAPIRRQVEADIDRVEIRAGDGIALVATFTLSRKVNRHCVLVQHGVGSNRHDMPGLKGALLLAGYNVLMPDSRAHGESGGELIAYGVLERGDLRRWIDFLTKRDCSEGIYALGISMGASVVLQAMADDSRILAAVAESPFSSFERIGEDRVRQILPPLGFLAKPIVWTGLSYARIRYGIDLAQANPSAAAPRIAAPVLLVHGSADTNIDPSHSRALLRLLPNARLEIITGARHAGCYGYNAAGYMKTVGEAFAHR